MNDFPNVKLETTPISLKYNSLGHSMGLTLLHSKQSKLHTILAFLNAIGLIQYVFGEDKEQDFSSKSATSQ